MSLVARSGGDQCTDKFRVKARVARYSHESRVWVAGSGLEWIGLQVLDWLELFVGCRKLGCRWIGLVVWVVECGSRVIGVWAGSTSIRLQVFEFWIGLREVGWAEARLLQRNGLTVSMGYGLFRPESEFVDFVFFTRFSDDFTEAIQL